MLTKTYVVTGVRGTIGSAIAKRLLADGHQVVGSYHSGKFTFAEGITLRYLDLRNPDRIQYFVNAVVDNFRQVDGLVNCAGVNYPNDFDKVTEMELFDVMAINATGTFLLTQKMLPHIRDGGAIVNIGSLSGFIGGKRSGHYAASKAALWAITQNVALFAAKRNIRCNMVSPGYVESKMTDKGAENEIVQKTISEIPLGRLGKPEEIAPAVSFLLSGDASYITGAVLHVNGGVYMG